jgi:hypothetical protein
MDWSKEVPPHTSFRMENLTAQEVHYVRNQTTTA